MRHSSHPLRPATGPRPSRLVGATRLMLVLLAVPAIMLGAIAAAALALTLLPVAGLLSWARRALRASADPGRGTTRLIA